MSQYSILDRRPEEEVLPLLHSSQRSLIARGPDAKGILTARGESKSEKGYLDYSSEELKELLEKLQALVHESRSLSQLAIRYVLSHEAVATTIPGASSREQLLQNVAASELPSLNAEEIALIQSISKANQYSDHR